jgi:hypothetical protein
MVAGTIASVIGIAGIAHADYAGSILGNEEAVREGLALKDQEPLKEKGYSPYAGKSFPTRVLWGDTHLHTKLSLDARAFGVTLGPEEAYRFARGDEITTSHGERIRLAGNEGLLRDPKAKDWHDRIAAGGDTALAATMEIIETFAGISGEKIPEVLVEKSFVRSVWERFLATADQYNDPGRFTAFIGYEWTSTTAESFNPEDLWRWMETYEQESGGKVLALAHNGNVSNGIMFPEINPETGERLTRGYAETRMRWEPIYEVTQIKGDGESHPFLSPNDEFAGYDTLWDKGNLGPVPKKTEMLQYEYAREALKNGLRLEQEIGFNPYKFGLVGSTDSHTGLATAEEENFFGKHSGKEPHKGRMSKLIGNFGDIKYYGWEQVSSGYAAVWATENTREAIWDAMKRKEVYATTGPRMTVRFFGGYDFTQRDAQLRDPGLIGYSKGVPMGGDLRTAKDGNAPSFLVAALKDPYSGNLDRIQIVKGWLDDQGKTHERVYDVVWSDGRKPGTDGRLPPVGNTVDVENASWTNTIGASELIAVWQDPDFDASQRAFYYARVIEIPTPRWSTYDALRFGEKVPEGVPLTTQERAYTSPIWYTP